MTKAIGKQIYKVDIYSTKAASEPIYTRILAKEANLQESWFRDAIFDNPEIVIGVCREAGLVDEGESWYAWAREFNLDAGPVDVLLLSSRGRIGIVETKLSFNPERRREVVAQICDYALALQEKAYGELPEMPTVEDTGLPMENDIRESLALGNFLLIIAGDQIDPRALRLGTAVFAGHLTREWDLAMVDMNLFVDNNSQPPRHLMIPELRGQLVREIRQVVRVIVQGEKPEAKIKIERVIPPPPNPTERFSWNSESFFAALASAQVSQEFRDFAQRVSELPKSFSGVSITYGTGQTGSLTVCKLGKSIISLLLNGKVEVKPRQYVESALGIDGAREYLSAIEQYWGKEYVDSWQQPSVDNVTAHANQILAALEKAFTMGNNK
jgi:hypothetical protein